MKRFAWQWLVISILMVGTAATAETRPHYGGTLRVATGAALVSLDPADSPQADSLARRNLTFLIFETLVSADAGGRLRPELATTWTTADNRRWEFRLQHDIRFHDRTPLTPDIAAASLRVANPAWKISSDRDAIVIEPDMPDPELLAELALPRNAIVRREPEGKLSGTGPFQVSDWQPGKKLVLTAEDNYWKGRPYLDAIEIELGKSFHDQLIELELGRTDLIEVAPEQTHRVALEASSVTTSEPVELIALLFSHDAQTSAEKSLRDALALSIDRTSIRSVLLQGTGQPEGSILPEWMTGYGFVFPADADLPQARRARAAVPAAPVWTLGYDASDSLAHLLADRIALNARDAGLTLQATTSPSADLRLVRVFLVASDPWIALRALATSAGMARPTMNGGTLEDLYMAEQTMLATQRLIPLFHLPVAYAASAALRDWKPAADGAWNLPDVWLAVAPGSGKP